MCNKLASTSRHVRVGLADPSDVPKCDICKNAPGMHASLFFVLCSFYFFSTEGFNLMFSHWKHLCSFLLLRD